VHGNDKVTADNWAGGVQVESIGDASTILANLRATKPYPHAYLDIQAAEVAYESVLANAGATLPRRDAVDERIVRMVRTGQVTYKEGKGIITDIAQVGSYPEYRGRSYSDSDGDGMPDAWETKHGLNPSDASDASGDLNDDGYTNIEDFINGLDPRSPKRDWAAPRTYVDLWKTDPDLRARLTR
jgi:hypothetical protein